jgi:6-phosphogluconolactonase
LVGGARIKSNSSIQILALNLTSGVLTELGASPPSLEAPSWLAWPSTAAVDSVFAISSGRITVGASALRWRAGAGGPSLAPVSGIGGFAKLPYTVHMELAPSGRYAVAAGYGKGVVSTLPIQPEPGGGWRLGTPLPPLQAGSKPHQARFCPSGRFVYVPCLASDWVRQFGFDDASGALTPVGLARLPPGSGPRHMAFHPTLPVVYVVNEIASTVVVFDWDRITGQLSTNFTAEPWRVEPTTAPSTPPPCSIKAPDGKACNTQAAAELAVTADGRFMYVSNRGALGGINSIVVFEISPIDGRLSPLAWEMGGGGLNFPRHLSLSPNDRFLLVSNQRGDSVMALARDAATGRLSLTSTLSTASVTPEPAFIAVVPPPGPAREGL